MARTLGQGRGMKRASFISRESSEQFMEFKTQVLKAYPGHPALESRWSGNPSPPDLPKTNMALDLPGWSGWTTTSSPRLKASEDKYILQLKKNHFQLSIQHLLVSGLFSANISQRNNSNTPDFASHSVLVLKSISGNSIGSLLEIHAFCQEEWSLYPHLGLAYYLGCK